MKKLATLLVFLSVATACSVQNYGKFRKTAEKFYESGKYEDAIEQYTHAIELKPSKIDLYLERGTALERLQRYEEAYSDFEKASVFDPKEVDAMYLMGRVSNSMGKYEQALAHLNRASGVAKRDARIYPEKVKTLLGLEMYDRALEVSDTAMLFREDDINYYQRGLVYKELKNDELARKDFEKALSKNRSFDRARLELADLLVRQGNLDEAMAHCSTVIKNNDRNTEAFLTRSRIYKARLDYPSAINDVSRNILVEPDNPKHYIDRGGYYQEFNQHPNAINDFSKAISLNSSDPDVYFKRAYSYEEIMDYEKAARDYAIITEISEFDPRARKLLSEAENRLYELNRETVAPAVSIVSPVVGGTTIEVKGDADNLMISGTIKEDSPLKSLVINGRESLFEKGSDGRYEFLANLDIEDTETIKLVATDDYDNITDLEYRIIRTEIDPPEISILRPYADDNGQIMLDNNNRSLYIQGKIEDNSLIKSIFIEGVTASYPIEQENPTFTATIDILNKEEITVIAEDVFENRQVQTFKINRQGAVISAENPMGKTWVVFLENSNYTSFASLAGPVKDVNLMKAALANYQVHNIIHKKDLSKEEMEKFFSIELRDMIKANQVNSLLIWYAGHGKFVNEVGYWIPVDAQRDDEFTYFNIAALRAALEPYANILTHTLVVTDACESGPSFYTAMRSSPTIKSCSDWRATQNKSSQVFMSAGYELASDDSEFTRTFARTLERNPGACIPVEEVWQNVKVALENAGKQEPKLGQITGLDHNENATFFFIAK
ncbi:MAG: tetratricopeptide repeat protein [Bacteroidales bacterium]|jgi:tetratricopeptide (TPR) repeat protein|nr:tetratricopeptide repeat protein [Bacteroidales bacterium]